TWTAVPSPAVANAGGELSGVAARSPSDAWAVGSSTNDLGQNQPRVIQPVIEHWNGSAWKIVPSPTISDPQSGSPAYATLTAIAALASNNVWAVGENSSTNGLLIEHWTGTKWVVVPVAAPTSGSISGLTGISARSASDIWAVGTGPLSNIL